MAKLIIRPAKQGDLNAFYDAIPASMRAVVVEKSGEVIAFGAVVYRCGRLLAISDMKPEMRQHKKSIVAAGRALMDVVRQAGAPVIAFACESETNSRGFLERLGFEYVEHTPTGAMYQWQQHYQ